MTLVIGLKTEDRAYVAADMYGTKTDETIMTIDKLVNIDSFIVSGSGNATGIEFIKRISKLEYEDEGPRFSDPPNIDELLDDFLQEAEELYQGKILNDSTPKGESFETWFNITGLSSMIMAYDSNIYRVESNFQKIHVISPYITTGCGETIALGVMAGLIGADNENKKIKVRCKDDQIIDYYIDYTPSKVVELLDELFIVVNKIMPSISKQYTYMDTKKWKKQIRNV